MKTERELYSRLQDIALDNFIYRRPNGRLSCCSYPRLVKKVFYRLDHLDEGLTILYPMRGKI